MNDMPEMTIPMHSLEAEQGVLGCVLLDAAAADRAFTKVPESGWFYDLRCKTIWQAMWALNRASKPLDIISVVEYLNNAGKVQEAGGTVFVVEVQDAVPSAANLDYYLEILCEKARGRAVMRYCAEVQLRLRDNPGAVQETVDYLESALMRLPGDPNSEPVIDGVGLATAGMEELDEYVRGTGLCGGVGTGFEYLDKLIGGFRGGEVHLLAGRPGTGKTSMVCNFMEALFRKKTAVGFFSLEMGKKAVGTRILLQMSRVNMQKFRTGMATATDLEKIAAAVPDLAGAPIWVDFTSDLSVMELRARARTMVRTHGVKLIAVDYFQLLTSPRRGRMDETEALQENSRGIMSLAKELDIPLVILCQLNRDIEKDQRSGGGNRRPRMSDLRGTGALEQDAHSITILYHPVLDERRQAIQDGWNTDWDDKRQFVNAAVVKNRNGATGDAEFIFYRRNLRFEDMHQDEEI